MPNKDVVIVIDDKVVRVSKDVWRTFHDCAGQMIRDGDHFDFYGSSKSKQHLGKVSELYRETNK